MRQAPLLRLEISSFYLGPRELAALERISRDVMLNGVLVIRGKSFSEPARSNRRISTSHSVQGIVASRGKQK